jgi:hypothetical protein
VGQRVLVGLPAQLSGGPLGLQQALAAAEELDPARAPLVDPVELVGQIGLQVRQRPRGVFQLGVQRAQLAQRGPPQPGQAQLGGERQRRREVVVGGAAVAGPAQRPAQPQLGGGSQLAVVGGLRGRDDGAQQCGGDRVLAAADQRPAVHDLRLQHAGVVGGQLPQCPRGELACLGEVRCRGLRAAVVQQALADLRAERGEPGGGLGGDGTQGPLAGTRLVGGLLGGQLSGVGGAALVVQGQRHELEVGQHGGQRAECVHQQRRRREARVEQAGRLDRLVHRRVDPAGEQFDAGVPGQAGGALEVVVLGVEGRPRRPDQRDGQRGVRGGLGAAVGGRGRRGRDGRGVVQPGDAGVQVQGGVLLGTALDQRVAEQRPAGLP